MKSMVEFVQYEKLMDPMRGLGRRRRSDCSPEIGDVVIGRA